MLLLTQTSVAIAARRVLFRVLTAGATALCLAVTSSQGVAQFEGITPDDPAIDRSGDRPGFQPARRPDILDLEFALQRADLVVVARLAAVTESKVVQGGRNVLVTEQFRFEPVRIIKGIFPRDTLLMTGNDLGVY
jgi:hypothetical protein